MYLPTSCFIILYPPLLLYHIQSISMSLNPLPHPDLQLHPHAQKKSATRLDPWEFQSHYMGLPASTIKGFGTEGAS